jgi:hypothetical protein
MLEAVNAPRSLLSDEDLKRWNTDGYLHIKSALSPTEVVEIRDRITELGQRFANLSAAERQRFLGLSGNDRDINIKQAVSFTSTLDPLTDHPGVFGQVLGLMGPYLQVAGTEVFLRYPHPERLLRLHTDGGPAFRRFFPQPGRPVLQLKVQFFLTDLSEPDSGNLTVVPGSHLIPLPDNGQEDAPGQRHQILAAPGDAVIFPWSLWHSVGPNRSGRVRVSTIIRYAQLWCRPQDYDKLEDAVFERLTPRRRLLFGRMSGAPENVDYFYRFYLPAPGEYVAAMFGDEWSDSREAVGYRRTESAVREGYSPRTRGRYSE